MNAYFFISFGVCFVCFALRTLFNVLFHKRSKFLQSKTIIIIVNFTMFILWFSWFFMCFNDPVKMNLPIWLRCFSLILFLIGISFFVLSHTRLKWFEDKGTLVTTGIYSRIRNPMYLGFILWVIGFPLFMQAFITLLSAIIWVPCFICWKKLEEKELEKKYEGYKEYKDKTWF